MRTWVEREAQSLLDALLEGVQVVDPGFRYVYLNPSAAKHGKSAREVLIGRTMMECYPGIDTTPMFGLIRSCLEQRTSHVIENAFLFPDGELRWFELRIEPVPEGACVLSLDITERKMTDAALRANEEFRRRTERDGETHAAVEGAVETIESLVSAIAAHAPRSVELGTLLTRTRARVEELRAYAQLRASHPRNAEPARILRDFDAMMAERGALALVWDPPLEELRAEVEVDPESIHSVLRALVSYLRDSFGSNTQVRASLGTIAISEDDARMDPESVEGNYVAIAIWTEENGVDDETVATMFRPDLARAEARDDGELGLAGARGVVRQNGGSLRVTSRERAFTRFELRLPLVS